jgi:glycosyltransferase involved in cell wall biosynthesis
MLDAMNCGAVVLGSDTAPVREMIQDGENGLLATFFNPDELADKAVRVLRDPASARALGRNAEKIIMERYSLEAVLPRMLALYRSTADLKLPGWQRNPSPAVIPALAPVLGPARESVARKSPFAG